MRLPCHPVPDLGNGKVYTIDTGSAIFVHIVNNVMHPAPRWPLWDLSGSGESPGKTVSLPDCNQYINSTLENSLETAVNYPVFERITWFHQQVKNQSMPNAAVLARRFEISGKTAQRNIDFMRDRMGAPLVYDPSQKGYHYSDDAFDLPRFPIDQQEILAVLIARNLLSGAAGGVISRALQQFEQKLFSEKIALGMDFSRIDDAFSSSWPGYSPAPSEIFQKAAFALMETRVLKFACASPGTGKKVKFPGKYC